MEKKNLTFLINRFLDGGMETIMLEYINYLNNTGNYNITLAIGLCMKGQEMFHDRIPKNVRTLYLVGNPILLKWKRNSPSGSYIKRRTIKLFDEFVLNPVRRVLTQYRLAKLAKTNDVIIDFDHSFSAFLRTLPVTKIVFFHVSLAVNIKNDRRHMERVKRRILTYDHIVTISQAMYEEAVEFFSDAKNRITMIYNAIDDVKVSHLSQSRVEDNRINKPFILTVMRLEEIQKDITTLIKAYRILCETYHHSEELYVIGKGDSLEQLQATANECGVSDQVHFLGFKSNPYPWIRKCKIFVQSSKYEGLPTTMIEALFLDKIIVATDCPTGPREILDGGNAGLLTPLKDASALAKAMHVALTDTSLQERIHEEIKKHRFVFSFESSGKKLEQLF